jgi:hypothetical protein
MTTNAAINLINGKAIEKVQEKPQYERAVVRAENCSSGHGEKKERLFFLFVAISA